MRTSREDFYRGVVGRLLDSGVSISNSTELMAEIAKVHWDWKSDPKRVKFVEALEALEENLLIAGGTTWLAMLDNMYLAKSEILAEVEKLLGDTTILWVTDELSDADPCVVKVTLEGTTHLLINDRNFREKLEKRGY